MTGQDGLRDEIAAALAKAEGDDIAVPLESAVYALAADAVLPVVQARAEAAEQALEDSRAAFRRQYERAEAAEQAVQRVRALHRRVGGYCRWDGESWPCRTARALDGTP